MSETEINGERVGALVGHGNVRHGAVRKIGDHNSGRSRGGWQRRAGGFRECAVQIAASQEDSDCSAALVHDGKVRYTIGVQVSRRDGHGSSSSRNRRIWGLSKSDIQILINGAQQDGYVVRALICTGAVPPSPPIQASAALP